MDQYTYRQTVIVEEIGKRGMKAGEYKEVRDVIFLPSGERSEKFIGKPSLSLHRLRMTEEDFRDVREVQPFLFTKDELWLYDTRLRGEEKVDGVDCWVLEVSPRQTLQGQRLFEGIFWVDQRDHSVVRTQGRAVPQILTTKSENLFPTFTTFRQKVDGKYSFPVHTHADDTLPFSSGPLRMRMTIRYENYKRFSTESSITFEPPK